MQKYWQLFLLSWQNGLVYRTSLLMWRLRQFLSTVMALTVWSVLFNSSSSLFGYDRTQMTTYIFLVGILQSLILATGLNGLSNQVYSGSFSFDLLKPINIYVYLFVQDMADKAKNVFFVVIESIILFLLFKPSIFFPSIETAIIFCIWVLGAVLLLFFIQLIFGSFGFYSPETWGPRFLFFMFVDFTAGKLFPLDILPPIIRTFVGFTPFPYFSFWQIQLFLGKLSPMEIGQHTVVLSIWIAIAGYVSFSLWQKGIKDYSAAGQ
ncbi:MAG: ABC-2 family transporter protein [Patescibacteria group bacterium]